ncbi:MAG: signal transduction histidine kinase [bacterium]|jgi:signal transduction histidine kinase
MEKNQILFHDDENDELIFTDEEDEEVKEESTDVWKVMIVDDDIEVHNVTRMVLSGFAYNHKKLQFICAESGEEAKKLIQEHPDTALILLDVVMEDDDSGLQVVKFIREELENHFVRIVLRTGQPGQAPEESVILAYDINDYKAKTELTSQKLFTTVVTSLRAYQAITALEEARDELKTAWKRAEEMNRLKDCFLANMRHELRTPLNGIMGFSSILEDQITNPELKSYIKIIQESGDRLLNTLNDILELVSLEAGQEPLDLKQFDVVVECQNILDNFQEQAKEKGLGFSFENLSVDDPAFIQLDKKIFDKILRGLLSNALKFTLEGEIKFQIAKEEGFVTICIRDTGVGVDQTFLPNIFDAFKQESDGYSRAFEGAGIGLTIVKQLTELMGGEIIPESIKGVGTVMTLKFPAM